MAPTMSSQHEGVGRRQFLHAGVVGGVAVAAGRVAEEFGRDDGQAPRATAVSVFDLEEATVADLQKKMESGQETARSLVEKYLQRVE